MITITFPDWMAYLFLAIAVTNLIAAAASIYITWNEPEITPSPNRIDERALRGQG